MSKKKDDLFKNVSKKNVLTGSLESLTKIAKEKNEPDAKLGCKIPQSVFLKFKSITSSKGMKMQDVITELMKEYLKKNISN
jgi:predicted DNA binding CopG/RHH family protein